MHRIRLREPWKATLNEDASAVVYSRKFHEPTGIEGHSLTLKISLLPRDNQDLGEISVVINGFVVERLTDHTQIEQPASAQNEPTNCIFFQLGDLQPFNDLEIRISGPVPTIDKHLPSPDATVIPTFGSFVIESVELQIE